MHISKVKINNYRNFNEMEVNLSNFNVIVGENNIGKTNFIQALDLALKSLRTFKSIQIRNSDFHDLAKPLVIRLTLEKVDPIIERDLTQGYDPLSKRIVIEFSAEYDIFEDEIRSRINLINEDLPEDENRLVFPSKVKKRIPFFQITPIRSAKDSLKSTRSSDIRNIMKEYIPGLTTPILVIKQKLTESLEDLGTRLQTISLNLNFISTLKNLVNQIEVLNKEDIANECKEINSQLKQSLNSITDIENGMINDILNDFLQISQNIILLSIKSENQKILDDLFSNFETLEGFGSFSSDFEEIIKKMIPASDFQLNFKTKEETGVLEKATLIVDSFSILDHGTGYQSKFVIAMKLLRALTYLNSFNLQSMIIGIEEPETHLHPHQQRNLMAVLKNIQTELKETKNINVQFILTSHSPEIVKRIDYDNLILFRKKDNGTFSIRIPSNVISDIALEIQKQKGGEIQKYEKNLKNEMNHLFSFYPEAFFSKVGILGEGPTEEGALPEFAKKLELSFDRYGITFVNTQGDGKLMYYQQIFEKFDIPYLYILDRDKRRNITDSKAFITDKKAFEDEILASFEIRTVLTIIDELFSDTSNQNRVNSIKKYLPSGSSINSFDDLISYASANPLPDPIIKEIRTWLINNKGFLLGYYTGKLCKKTEIPKIYKQLIIKASQM